jgi:hypothetical protein
MGYGERDNRESLFATTGYPLPPLISENKFSIFNKMRAGQRCKD